MSIDDIYQQVIDDFKITGSVKKTAQNVGTTLVRAQRILITEGLWSSPTSEKVVSLYSKGKSVKEIAAALFISEKTVQAYLPYTKTEKGYGGENRSADAKKSEDYRKRMHLAASSQVSKKDMKKERDLMKREEIKSIKIVEREEWEALREESDRKIAEESKLVDTSKMTVDELYNSHMKKEPNVFKLKLSLDTKYLDEQDWEILRKYGKVEKGITREILVPADITLHALNYAILRSFGWQNSHLHSFRLPKQVFQKLTGGKNKVDAYDLVTYDGRFMNWVNLCGIYFRFPCEDFADLYWDDDYENGQSIKTWFRKKYTGPYRYNGVWENYHYANSAARRTVSENPTIEKHISFQEWEQLRKEGKDPADLPRTMIPIESASIWDFNSYFAGGMDELLERIPLIELLIPKGIKADKNLHEEIKYLQKYQAKAKNNLPVMPVTDELIYAYDYGDGWEVKIEMEECYYTKTRLDTVKEKNIQGGLVWPVSDDQWLADTTAFDRNNQKLDADMALKIATVTQKQKPICLSVDGLSLMDDVGGIGGYVDFLRTIHGDDQVEKEESKEWAKWMGWTGRMTTPENLL